MNEQNEEIEQLVKEYQNKFNDNAIMLNMSIEDNIKAIKTALKEGKPIPEPPEDIFI